MQHALLDELNNYSQFQLSNLIFDSNLFEQIELKPTTRLVLITLCRYYPNIFPSMETIMKKAGIGSKDTINNAIKELKQKGLIIYSVEKDKKSNNYKFTLKFFELLKIVPAQSEKQVNNSTNSVPNKTNYNNIKKPFKKTNCYKNNNNSINNTYKIKKLLNTNSFLTNKQQAEVILNSYHRYNINDEGLKTVLQIQKVFNFPVEKFEILKLIQDSKKLNDVFCRKIENMQLEINMAFAGLKT